MSDLSLAAVDKEMMTDARDGRETCYQCVRSRQDIAGEKKKNYEDDKKCILR